MCCRKAPHEYRPQSPSFLSPQWYQAPRITGRSKTSCPVPSTLNPRRRERHIGEHRSAGRVRAKLRQMRVLRVQTMGAVRVKEDGALQRAGQGQAPCGYGALMTRLPGNGRLGGVLTCLPEVRGRVADRRMQDLGARGHLGDTEAAPLRAAHKFP